MPQENPMFACGMSLSSMHAFPEWWKFAVAQII